MTRTPARFRETLTVPLRWWVQVTMLLATFWLAFVVAMPMWVATVFAGILALIIGTIFLVFGSASVEVRDGQLRAGGAVIDLAHVGPARPLGKVGTRQVLGVDADARAYLLTRPYLKYSVQVPIRDPQDPTPYWLLSSRHPRKLAAALDQARATHSSMGV